MYDRLPLTMLLCLLDELTPHYTFNANYTATSFVHCIKVRSHNMVIVCFTFNAMLLHLWLATKSSASDFDTAETDVPLSLHKTQIAARESERQADYHHDCCLFASLNRNQWVHVVCLHRSIEIIGVQSHIAIDGMLLSLR
jgi:hypothetical protein